MGKRFIILLGVAVSICLVCSAAVVLAGTAVKDTIEMKADSYGSFWKTAS